MSLSASGRVRGHEVPLAVDQDRGARLVRGQDDKGRYVQVVYLIDEDGETFYVIHARPLEGTEKRASRRSRR